jgi:PAS domain-containing protein
MALSFPIEVDSLPMDRSAGFHHKVVDGIEDLLLVLAEDGRISYASPKSYSLIQVKSEAMVGQYISTYMNVDDIPVFLVDFKEHMASGTSWRSHHRLRRADDTFKSFESTFTPYTGVAADSSTGSRRSTKMCLMTARPYQMASTSLMDSYLEHYTTNLRLEKKLARLRGEAEDYHRSTKSTPRASVEDADTTTQRVTFRMGPTTSTAVSSKQIRDQTRQYQRKHYVSISFMRIKQSPHDQKQQLIRKQTAANEIVKLALSVRIRISSVSQEKLFRLHNIHQTTSRLCDGRYGNRNHHLTPRDSDTNRCLDSQTTQTTEKARALCGVFVQRMWYNRLSRMAQRSPRRKDAL